MAVRDRKELKIDWLSVLFYVFFVVFGLINVYAASIKDPANPQFNLNTTYGKQLFFVAVSAVVAFVILNIDTKIIEFLSYAVYGACIFMIIVTYFVSKDVNGARSWIEIGSFRLQPAEFMKIGTAMAVSRFMSDHSFSFKRLRDRAIVVAMIVVPALMIIKQQDTGTALAFSAFVFMFFREGMSSLYAILFILIGVFSILALLLNIVLVIAIIIGLALFAYYVLFGQKYVTTHIILAVSFCTFVLSVNLIINKVLQPHQRDRIHALFDSEFDPMGVNYATTQSKIAIGSGGMVGKGFMKGTQTKFDFVPQQHTDYIFCTIGEEWGWVGSTVLLLLFLGFLAQIMFLAENARSNYARIYGYCIAGIIFIHLAINIGMTIGLAPVIGIPLPFFSYGGSAMLSFTIMLFILLNLYAQRVNVLKSR